MCFSFIENIKAFLFQQYLSWNYVQIEYKLTKVKKLLLIIFCLRQWYLVGTNQVSFEYRSKEYNSFVTLDGYHYYPLRNHGKWVFNLTMVLYWKCLCRRIAFWTACSSSYMTSKYMRKVLRGWKTTLLTPVVDNQSWLRGLLVYLTLSLEPWSKIHEDHVNKKLWLAVQKRINKVVLREEYRVKKLATFPDFYFKVLTWRITTLPIVQPF